ncbi:MAG: efflux RND transporter periplasmic adaptor subunit, partial [Verrucomicrobiota bacterium]
MESCPASGAWRLAKFFACCPRSLPLLALLVGMTGCQQDAPVPVQLEKVVRRDLTELVTATGKIQPVTQVKISPEVSGEIVELPVKEGDRVKKGDLLVKIRPELYEAALRQAEAGYQGALAGQEQARANLAKAEAEFRRNKELFEKNLVSASIYDEFRTLGEVARANVNAASHQVEQAAAV